MSEPMSEDALNRIQAMIDKAVQTVREEVRGEILASEQRLAEGGRLQFQQLAGIYRSTVEKVEHLEKHLGERIELARRVTALETRPER